jgi:hypothetical protein
MSSGKNLAFPLLKRRDFVYNERDCGVEMLELVQH